MKVKICQSCKFPVDQCQCSNVTKENWQREQTRILLKRIDHLDAVTSHKKDLLSHKEDIEKKIKQDRDRLNYENNSFEVDDDIADTIFVLWEKGYDTCFCNSYDKSKQV